MASWADFAAAAPDMAEILLRRPAPTPIMYLATVRRDGAPRLHPVCPFIAEGRLFVAVPAWSPKRHDLRRDGRFALHALPGPRDEEFYLTGRATLVTDPATREQAAMAARHTIHPDDWLFEFAIEYAMTAYWENAGQPGTYPVRQTWRAP